MRFMTRLPEAPAWASLTRAIYDRVLATYSQDGYYYEGFEYWIFSTPVAGPLSRCARTRYRRRPLRSPGLSPDAPVCRALDAAEWQLRF